MVALEEVEPLVRLLVHLHETRGLELLDLLSLWPTPCVLTSVLLSTVFLCSRLTSIVILGIMASFTLLPYTGFPLSANNKLNAQ